MVGSLGVIQYRPVAKILAVSLKTKTFASAFVSNSGETLTVLQKPFFVYVYLPLFLLF